MRAIKLTLIGTLSMILVLYFWLPLVQAKQGLPVVRKCPKGHVWERPHMRPNGTMAPGYCRPLKRGSYRWVPSARGQDGKWRRGYWVPNGPPPPKKEWVPGHYNKQGNWVNGRYRSRPAPAGGVFKPRVPPGSSPPPKMPFGK